MLKTLSSIFLLVVYLVKIESLILSQKNHHISLTQQHQVITAWQNKIRGYKKGQKVLYSGNIFNAINDTKSRPGTSLMDGWSLFQEIYQKNQTYQQFNVVGYLSIWSVNNITALNNLSIYKDLTHVILSSLVFESNLSTAFNSSVLNKIKSIIKVISGTLKQNKIKLMVGLGGGNDCAMNGLFANIGGIQTQNNSKNLLNSLTVAIQELIRQNQLDGIDFDLQCWSQQAKISGLNIKDRLRSDGPSQSGVGLIKILTNLRKNLSQTKILSAAVSSTPHYGNNFHPLMHQFVDWLGIMTYDFTGSWDRSPVGPHSALRKINNQSIYENEQQEQWPGGSSFNPILSAQQSLWYWSNPFYKNKQGLGFKVPRKKLMLGVPFYGYDFSQEKKTNPKTNQRPVGYLKVSYSEIVQNYFQQLQNMTNEGNIKIEGQTDRPIFVKKSGQYKYKHNIYFQSQKLVSEKVQFAKKVGCQGVIVWEILSDTTTNNLSLLYQIKKTSQSF